MCKILQAKTNAAKLNKAQANLTSFTEKKDSNNLDLNAFVIKSCYSFNF